jgi:hypothetical protein
LRNWEDPMQVEQPLTEAIRAFYATLRQHPTLSLDVAECAQLLTNFQLTDQGLSFTLERHPHILGRPAEGMLPYPHFLVEQRYVFDLKQHTLTLAQERCIGWEADAEALAYEDVEATLDFGGLSDECRVCTSEDEVRTHAAREADGMIADFPETLLCMPDEFVLGSSEQQRWEHFCEEFSKHWRASYIELVVERWRERQEEAA